MKNHEKLELNMVIESLANTFAEIGILPEDVNMATVKLSNYLKNIDVITEQGFFNRIGDFLGGLSARVGLKDAMTPNQLEQQRKAIMSSLTNYVKSLENAGIKNANEIFGDIARKINSQHLQALKAVHFGGKGISASRAAKKQVNKPASKSVNNQNDPADNAQSPHPVVSTANPNVASYANQAVLQHGELPKVSQSVLQPHSVIA